MKSVMSHSFATIPQVKLPRARFDRSCGYKTTFDGSYLIPVGVREVLPGDTVKMNMTFFSRLNTPLVPCMDNIFLDSFFFFVPCRLVWDNFKKFMGEQDNPADTTDYTVPVLDHTVAPISTTGFVAGTLYDYFGLPTDVVGIQNINALPIRAYNLIWNEWFRDQNIQDSVVVDKDDADMDPADYELLKRGKRHDYFTSCLPWPQKNNTGTDVTVPLGTSAPVIGDSNPIYIHRAGADEKTLQSNNTSKQIDGSGANWASTENLYWGKIVGNTDTGLIADLTTATTSTINQLREAFQVQRLYERDARGGTRYIELIRSHFGVVSSDARLQRSEYLGGGSTAININSVANTAGTKAADSPDGLDRYQGDLAAFGTASGTHGFTKSFEEHGYIIVLVAARADITYQQGLQKLWSRQTRLDFYWPTLAHLGEQAVLTKELYCNADGNDDTVFGYQERYGEYRYGQSLITGQFRSNHATSLDLWHLSEEFGAHPHLDVSFIEDQTPFDRIVAVPSEPHFKFDAYFNEQWTRCMPVYSVPGMIDHL